MNLYEYPKNECLDILKGLSTRDLYDYFLLNQTNLFFNAELEWLKNQFWWKASTNILEIGCGNGSYISKLSENFNTKKYLGVDNNSYFINLSKERHCCSHLSFEISDAQDYNSSLKFSNDIVFFRLILQYLKDPLSALKHAHKYLRKDGYILIIESYDLIKKTSHPIDEIDRALEQIEEKQKTKREVNRKISFEILSMFKNKESYISKNFTCVFSNLDLFGNLIQQNVYYEINHNRKLYFNHGLFILEFFQRNYKIEIDLSKAFDELMDYSQDADAWTSPGMHFLVLKPIF